GAGPAGAEQDPRRRDRGVRGAVRPGPRAGPAGLLLHSLVEPAEQPGEFRDLGRVPVGEAAGVAGAAGLADPADPVAALLGQGDQPGPAVGGVGFAGNEAEVLERVELPGHRGLADADVGGEFGGPLLAAFIQTD